MKKVLYLSTYPKDSIGAFSGTNRRIFDALSEMDGYQVAYYQARPNPLIKFALRSYGAIYRLCTKKPWQSGFYERYYPSVCRRVLSHLKKHQYDAIVCWQLCFGGVFEKFGGRKLFFADATYHKEVPYYEWVVAEKQFRRNDHSQRLLLNRCDAYMCFSSFFVEDAIGYYGCPRDNVHLFRFFPTLFGKGFCFKKRNEFHFLLVGTNYYDKGVPLAIETIKLLNKRGLIKAKLSIIGVQNEENVNDESIRFEGVVSQFEDADRLRKYYEDADIFIMPSRHECAGIVFAEAASFGLPAISFKTGGIPDYVSDGESGFLLEPSSTAEDFANLIEREFMDREALKMYGGKAYSFYQRSLARNVFIKEAKALFDSLFGAKGEK